MYKTIQSRCSSFSHLPRALEKKKERKIVWRVCLCCLPGIFRLSSSDGLYWVVANPPPKISAYNKQHQMTTGRLVKKRKGMKKNTGGRGRMVERQLVVMNHQTEMRVSEWVSNNICSNSLVFFFLYFLYFFIDARSTDDVPCVPHWPEPIASPREEKRKNPARCFWPSSSTSTRRRRRRRRIVKTSRLANEVAPPPPLVVSLNEAKLLQLLTIKQESKQIPTIAGTRQAII